MPPNERGVLAWWLRDQTQVWRARQRQRRWTPELEQQKLQQQWQQAAQEQKMAQSQSQ
jgi:hypothetical protein